MSVAIQLPVKVVDAALVFPYVSVPAAAFTFKVITPSAPELPLLVAVIVYVVPDPLNVPRVQLVPVLASEVEVKPVTAELKVMVNVVADVLVVAPLLVKTLLVIVTLGDTV